VRYFKKYGILKDIWGVIFMEQSYRDKLRNFLKNNSEEDWLTRMTNCSHRILTAVCFKESSENIYEQIGNRLFPCLGFYYAVFHMGVAMLYLDFTTPVDNLKKIHHEQLKNLINNKLIQKKLIPQDYSKIFNELQKIREFANYQFGIFESNVKDLISNICKETERAFNIALSYIKEVCAEVERIYYISFDFIAGYIGDNIGDDRYKTYFSDIDEKRIIDYLISKNLTT